MTNENDDINIERATAAIITYGEVIAARMCRVEQDIATLLCSNDVDHLPTNIFISHDNCYDGEGYKCLYHFKHYVCEYKYDEDYQHSHYNFLRKLYSNPLLFSEYSPHLPERLELCGVIASLPAIDYGMSLCCPICITCRCMNTNVLQVATVFIEIQWMLLMKDEMSKLEVTTTKYKDMMHYKKVLLSSIPGINMDVSSHILGYLNVFDIIDEIICSNVDIVRCSNADIVRCKDLLRVLQDVPDIYDVVKRVSGDYVDIDQDDESTIEDVVSRYISISSNVTEKMRVIEYYLASL